MMPDIIGACIGLMSIAVLYLLYKHCDALSDGNVGAANENTD